MSIEVLVDRTRCMGSGNCLYWAEGTFDLDDEHVAVVVGDPSADEERVRLAVEHCPTDALSINAGP